MVVVSVAVLDGGVGAATVDEESNRVLHQSRGAVRFAVAESHVIRFLRRGFQGFVSKSFLTQGFVVTFYAVRVIQGKTVMGVIRSVFCWASMLSRERKKRRSDARSDARKGKANGIK